MKEMDSKLNQSIDQDLWKLAQEKIAISKALRIERQHDSRMQNLVTQLLEVMNLPKDTSITGLIDHLQALPEDEQKKVVQQVIH